MTLPASLEHTALAIGALTGVLAARGKQLDLFGVLVLAVVTAFGGGTVRDILVGDTPVAWLRKPDFLYTALGTGSISFLVCRRWQPPGLALQVADAGALALFNVVGASKGFHLNLDASVSVMLGVITGVAGGILRDTLLGQVPMVFRRNTYLYATAAALSGVLYAVLLKCTHCSANIAELSAVALCFLLRLAALRWRLALPEMH